MVKGMSIVKRNEMLRALAVEEIDKNGLKNFLMVAGTKVAKDFEVENEFYPVRIDIVTPKDTGEFEEFTAIAMHEEFMKDLEQKKIDNEAKARAKETKMLKDKAKRENAKKVK